jgi:putative FmdB family regulatory protein
MPIYEYRCDSCGHQQEFLQKVSDAPLTVCTRCDKPTFSKMLTAAGFQLKGSGWYATDFKNGSKGAKKEPADKPAETTAESKTTESSADKKADSTEKKSESTEKKSESNGTKPAAPASDSSG